jgi:hypothetical protein
MFRTILLSKLLAFSFYLHADAAPTFDEVIYGDQIVAEKVEAGFGMHTVLELIEADEIRPHYLALREYGAIRVLAQKLEPQNAGETKTTRYTFEAWRRVGFVGSELAATWTVDVYSYENIMDHRPDYYRIGNIIPVE